MTLYAALLYYPADSYWTTPEEAEWSADYAAFGAAAGAAGVLRGGEALHPAGTATTIAYAGGKNSDLAITDGPYAEAKEVLGGFYLVEAADLDEAVRWAAQIPAAWRGKVELRPVVPMNGPSVTAGG
jgi:hypothetical protein